MRLKQALDAKGITQRSCAELLGMAEKTLYNKIVGNTEFTYGEVRRLKAMLPEYDISFLLSGETAAGTAYEDMAAMVKNMAVRYGVAAGTVGEGGLANQIERQ